MFDVCLCSGWFWMGEVCFFGGGFCFGGGVCCCGGGFVIGDVGFEGEELYLVVGGILIFVGVEVGCVWGLGIFVGIGVGMLLLEFFVFGCGRGCDGGDLSCDVFDCL